MQLFELVSPRLFRPLAGPNRAFYAELLLLLWEECRHTADYSISRAEAVSRAEDYFAALAKPLALDADGAGDEDEQPTRDPHTLAVGFLLRLRRTGWLEEQPGSYETEPTLAFMPEVTPLLDALEEILNPRVVTYTGKLYKAWQLLGSIGQEKSPYENVLREVAADLETLNKSLRALNASIGHYIDRLTHNRTPQEVLELFDQYEEKVVAAAYHRFKTSDNLFNYQAKVIKELAAKESCVIVGRCADYVLKDYPNVVSVFVHADRKFCLDRSMERHSMTEKEMQKYIEKTDQYRGDFYRYHTGHEWVDARNYDLCLDSSKLGYERCVDEIISYMKVRFPED